MPSKFMIMKRTYSYKNLPMLITASIIIENMEVEKEAFEQENPKWAHPFGANIQAQIDFVLKEFFGINSKEKLKEKTMLVKQLKSNAADNLSMVKTQIERGFRKQKERAIYLLEKLGYKEYWNKASHENQTELIGLLLKFSNNLTDEIRTELEKNGVNSNRISRIIDQADTLKKANITQETLKGTSKIDTGKAVAIFNEIYEQAMDICHVGKKLFKKDRTKRDMFVFRQLINKQTSSGNAPLQTSTVASLGQTVAMTKASIV
jgi:hypothetical protein